MPSIQFSVSHSRLSVSVTGSYKETNPLGTITVMGVKGPVSDVKYNGKSICNGCWASNNSSAVLTVMDLTAVTGSGAWYLDWQLSWD